MFPLLRNICCSASSLLTLACDSLVETGWAAVIIGKDAGFDASVKHLHHGRCHAGFEPFFATHVTFVHRAASSAFAHAAANSGALISQSISTSGMPGRRCLRMAPNSAASASAS